jgi:tRNA (cmo5U34)-methyltransferase
MTELQTDQTMPEGPWAFNDEVTKVFDNMLQRSIPQYMAMRELCLEVGSRFVQPKTDIVDLGASRGEAIAPFVDQFGAYNRYAAVEVSEPMLKVLRERFAGWIKTGLFRVLDTDLRYKFPPVQASLILSVLTLQFTPIEYRQRIVSGVHEHLMSGGAFVLVEKVLGEDAFLDTMLVDTYYGFKRRNGYSEDAIQRKRLSLEGVLVPVTARWNEELLRGSGFRKVECFWRWANFAAWVAVK